jgi:hypothetical protein
MKRRIYGLQWYHIGVLVLLVALIALAIWTTPTLTAVVLGCALVVLSAHVIAASHALYVLREQVASADHDTKLEVGSGNLGALSYQINRLLHQRRAQQRLLALAPMPAPHVAARLVEHPPADQRPMLTVALLAIMLPPPHGLSAAHLRTLSSTVLAYADAEGALISYHHTALLLSFGHFDEPLDHVLNCAYRTALALARSWPIPAAELPPTFILTSGNASASTLPGLGYTLLGSPVQQFVHLAATALPHQLTTSEATYIHLRRLGQISATRTITRSPTAPHYYTISLDPM